MPNYKLTYFNISGIGEPIRYLLAYGNQEFEEKRINFENWPELKKTYPLGKLPFLEFNGKSYNQSIAIVRYLAKQSKLNGKNDLEDLVIDGVADTIVDIRLAAMKYAQEKDPEIKKTLLGPLQNETLPLYMDHLEKLAKENNGYLAVGRLTWADLVFAAEISFYNYLYETDILKSKPTLISLVEKVKNIQGIKDYLAKIAISHKPAF